MAIKVPRDIVKKGKYEIQWNPYVVSDINNRLRRTIIGVSEYSRDILNKEYVPRDISKKSELEYKNDFTVNIKWRAPNANRRYYDKTVRLKGKRGHSWFDRMIDDYRYRIEQEANRLFKG